MVLKSCISNGTMASSSSNPYSITTNSSSTPIKINHFVSLKLDPQRVCRWHTYTYPCHPKFITQISRRSHPTLAKLVKIWYVSLLDFGPPNLTVQAQNEIGPLFLRTIFGLGLSEKRAVFYL